MTWAQGRPDRQRRLDRQWRALQAARALFLLLPHRLALALGSGLGWLLWACSKKRVDNAEVRAGAVLCVGPTAARAVVRESYRNLGRAVAEMLRIPKLKKKGFERYVVTEGTEHLDAALQGGQGAIILLAHLDNWEMVNLALSVTYPIHAIAAPQRDPRLTDLLTSLRAEAGAKAVNKGGTLRAAVDCLKKGEVLAVLYDQDAKDGGVIVPFLGVPASTPLGPVKLAERWGSPILPVSVVREGVCQHRVRVHPALELTGDLTEDAKRCNDALGAMIFQHPEQWLLWLYPRWGRPEPEVWRHDLVD